MVPLKSKYGKGKEGLMLFNFANCNNRSKIETWHISKCLKYFFLRFFSFFLFFFYILVWFVFSLQNRYKIIPVMFQLCVKNGGHLLICQMLYSFPFKYIFLLRFSPHLQCKTFFLSSHKRLEGVTKFKYVLGLVFYKYIFFHWYC